MAALPHEPFVDDDDATTLAWEVELDRLELDVLRTERLIKAITPLEVDPWVVPESTGPMPAHLLPRALEIHERQLRVLGELARAMRRGSRQRSFAAHVARATAVVPGPAYVDTTG